MKIYTSYFGNLKRLQKAGLVPIGISQYPPRFFMGISMKELAPTARMLGKDITWKQYMEMYSLIIGKLNQAEVVKKLARLSMGRDVVLLCFEKDQSVCHRSLVAGWLNKAGYNVEEFEAYRNKPIQPVPPQGSLFELEKTRD